MVQYYYHGKKRNKRYRQSESITFRLDTIVLNKLHREAEQREISINTLVSQILREHTDWHSHAAKAGFISEKKALLVNLIDRLSEQEITSVAEDIAKRDIKDFVLLLRNKYNIESSLDVIETWIRYQVIHTDMKSATVDIHMLYSMIWAETGLFIWQSCIDFYLKNST